MQRTPWVIVVLPALIFGAILGGLWAMYFRLGKSSTWNESATADQPAYVAFARESDEDSQGLVDVMRRSGATHVQLVDQHGIVAASLLSSRC